MNREILFKAKRMDNGAWVEGFPVTDRWIDCGLGDLCECDHDGSDMSVIYFWDHYLHEFDECDVDINTLCQYTGLKDCNGKRIFEGDIIKTNLDFIQEVRWIDRYAAFACITIGDEDEKLSVCDILDEVIGNRWDNPELLEVQG